MNIHIFIAHMGIGGAERVCVNLANEFATMGHTVHIVALNLENDVNTHLLQESVQVHSLGVSRLRYSPVAMLRYVKAHRPEFLFVFGNEMAVILNKMKKCHLITTPLIVRVLNNVDISLSREDHVSPIVEKYLKQQQKQLRSVDHVIAQCNGMGSMLLEHGLVKKENLTTIYNPVSRTLIETTDRIRIPFVKRDQNRVKEVIFIGRIDPQKNLSHLLKAFSIVYQENQNVRLRLIGDGNVLNAMKQCALEMGIRQAVAFEGVRKDMDKIYAEADVVALSSEYEGMPNCLIEAIGCGIPIVSYDCPLGPAEIVEDSVNGFLVEYHNVTKLAEALKSALERNWDEQEIRKTAAKFEVTNIAEKYIRIFEQYQ